MNSDVHGDPRPASSTRSGSSLTIRGKLLIFALEIVVAVMLLVTTPPFRAGALEIATASLSILAIAFAFVMGQSIARSLDHLVRVTRRIRGGDYSEPALLERNDEIGVLASEIERMRVDLRDKVELLEELSRGLERKVDERTAELREANARLELVHEVTNAVHASADLPSLLETLSRAAKRLLSFEASSIVHVGPGGVFTELPGAVGGEASAPIAADERERIGAAIRGGEPATCFTLEDGRREVVIPLRIAGSVVGAWRVHGAGAPGATEPRVEALLPVAGDVAAALLRIEAHARERESARRLRELSELKSHFVSKTSHELRTPLTSILGGVENLLDGIAGSLEERPRRYLLRIRENGRRLLGLINDLLDLSKIESGEEELRPSTFELGEVVAETVETVRSLADAQQVTLVVEAAVNPVLVADREKIARVLLNLVDNAIKFSNPKGTVTIEVSAPVAGSVRLAVRDQGAGIPPEELPRVFERFHQVRGGAPRRGTGLGLAIARELVTMHGGAIAAESVLGSGSLFVVTLPIGASSGKAA